MPKQSIEKNTAAQKTRQAAEKTSLAVEHAEAARGQAVADAAPAPSRKSVPRATKPRVREANPRRGATVAPAGKQRARSRPLPAARSRHAEGTAGALLAEIRAVKELVRKMSAPIRSPDAALDNAVYSLQRLLSELIEDRMEAIVRDLVAIRDLCAAGDSARVGDRLDALLEQLGAARFGAEPMDVVDPLIHVVMEERQRADAPDGVILATLRPGYRSGRGMVLCKAAVAVNRTA